MTKKSTDRYSVPSDEDFEPDSNNQVLKNFRGIKSKKEMDDAESEELDRMEIEVMDLFDESHQFTAEDIMRIHKLWLKNIYSFAGKYRTVSMSKQGFPFAAPSQIPRLMQELECNYLQLYTPCNYVDDNDLANAIGVVHVELIIIHPFREGNGRTARLLADLMAAQANRPNINYASIDQLANKTGYENYITAIHEGFKGNYDPIRLVFLELLAESLPE